MFTNMFAMRDGQSIGELVFGLFQMTFAIITPALIVGAWVERARFGWVVAFSALWSLLVYVPVARWVWGNGFLFERRRDRFCRWHCRAHNRRRIGAGRGLDAG